MEAVVNRQNGVLVVEIKGRLNLEGTFQFRRACNENWRREKIVFDLSALSFVGSLGLKDFVDTLDQMVESAHPAVRLCGLSSEFKRLFDSTGVAARVALATRAEALASLLDSIPDVKAQSPSVES